ncbi:hypothetical protein PVAP13_6KG070535 [Panicum virgatum]|uniref:Uncharacterized protein n=1 Tax=Panicum virgatum TaxID=38727 RepID=A0A8T0R7E6_PANVG|nr:hypothetical protein PVAP13_6KG070535 [Panicum virgatum]
MGARRRRRQRPAWWPRSEYPLPAPSATIPLVPGGPRRRPLASCLARPEQLATGVGRGARGTRRLEAVMACGWVESARRVAGQGAHGERPGRGRGATLPRLLVAFLLRPPPRQRPPAPSACEARGRATTSPSRFGSGGLELHRPRSARVHGLHLPPRRSGGGHDAARRRPDPSGARFGDQI